MSLNWCSSFSLASWQESLSRGFSTRIDTVQPVQSHEQSGLDTLRYYTLKQRTTVTLTSCTVAQADMYLRYSLLKTKLIYSCRSLCAALAACYSYYYIPIYLYMLNFPLPSGNIVQFFVLKKAQSCDYAKIPYYTGFWHCLYFIGWICSYSTVPRWRPKARLN